jgi:hypothetical protein
MWGPVARESEPFEITAPGPPVRCEQRWRSCVVAAGVIEPAARFEQIERPVDLLGNARDVVRRRP